MRLDVRASSEPGDPFLPLRRNEALLLYSVETRDQVSGWGWKFVWVRWKSRRPRVPRKQLERGMKPAEKSARQRAGESHA